MSVLSIMQAIKKRRLLPSHPVAGAKDDVRKACTSLWLWAAEADGPINETEKVWLGERFKSVLLDDVCQEDYFAGVAEEQTVLRTLDLLTTIPKSPSRWLIFCECWLLAACDGEIRDEENDFLDAVSEFLGIASGEATWLKNMALAIAQGNKAEFRSLAGQGMQNHQQIDTIFWRVLLSYMDRPQDLIASLTDIYMAQGVECERKGLDNEALNRYDAALAIDAACATAYLAKGAIFSRQARWQAAIEEYSLAVDLVPHNFQTYFQRGLVYQTLGESEKALQDFGQAISLNSELAVLYHHRGQVHAERKAYKLAIDDYDQAVEREPGNDEYYHSLAYAYCHSGQFYQAILKISRAIDISPGDPNWYDSRAEFYIEQGNAESALADCAQALSLDPCFARAYYLRGVIQDKAGNASAAAENYRRYLELASSEDVETSEVRERLEAL